MKKSAIELNNRIANSKLYVIPKMGHGEIELNYPKIYIELIMELFNS